LAVAAVFALLKLMPMMSHSFTQFCSGGVTRFWVLVYCLLSVDYVQVEGRIVRKFSRCVHIRVCNRGMSLNRMSAIYNSYVLYLTETLSLMPNLECIVFTEEKYENSLPP